MNDKERFIAGLYGPARQVSAETGASWETILAQAAQETGWGQKVLPGTNNIFNIKADKGWHGETKTFRVWEIENGKKVWKDQPFRVYASTEEALRDRVEFLRANPRYEKAGLFNPEIAGSIEREAEALQRAGYATDPRYAKNLVAVFSGRTMQSAIVLAQSHSPSRAVVHAAMPTQQHSAGHLNRGDRGEAVRELQQQLDHLGYRSENGRRLSRDGDFGQRTEEALKAFQLAHGLPPVGHVGPRTQAALEAARLHGAVPVDPAHPDHALQRQVSRAVDAMERSLGRHPDENSERLKASLLLAARQNGLTGVDHVVLSEARGPVQAGQHVFAVQGRIDDPASRRVHVATQQALATPVQASWARLAEVKALERGQPRNTYAHVFAARHGEHGDGMRRTPSP
jgi:peptidoglycan hydrolase-like protein with peptidoglycan-binding domain